jgi:hypothetical protein
MVTKKNKNYDLRAKQTERDEGNQFAKPPR